MTTLSCILVIIGALVLLWIELRSDMVVTFESDRAEQRARYYDELDKRARYAAIKEIDALRMAGEEPDQATRLAILAKHWEKLEGWGHYA